MHFSRSSYASIGTRGGNNLCRSDLHRRAEALIIVPGGSIYLKLDLPPSWPFSSMILIGLNVAEGVEQSVQRGLIVAVEPDRVVRQVNGSI